MKTKIHVTREHIDEGESTCSGCPVALAIMDVLKPRARVDVLPYVAAIEAEVYHRRQRKTVVNVDMPRAVKRFATRFDKVNMPEEFGLKAPPCERSDLNPFAFWLDLPPEMLRQKPK